MDVRINIPCPKCGFRHAERAEPLKRMVERSGADNFRLEHTCPACGQATMFDKSFAEMVLKIAP